MRHALILWTGFMAFLNVAIFFMGLKFINIENKSDKHDGEARYTSKKTESGIPNGRIVKIFRRNDDKIQKIFFDTQAVSAELIDKNRLQSSKEIEKSRLVGIIVPLEGNLSKTAIVEYGMPTRTLRLRQGDIIPGTSWKIKNIDDREIILNNNSVDLKMTLK